MSRSQSSFRWYADPSARRLIGLRYLPWLAALSLAWEIVQLPLYTIWHEGPVWWIAFSVAHCTIGDAMIGVAALALALIFTRAGQPSSWPWARVAVLTALLAAAYTVFSEWVNAGLLGHWQYSAMMPVLALDGIRIGLSPMMQWLVVAPAALAATRAAVARRANATLARRRPV